MATMLSARATWKLVRSGDLRARVRATRDGQAAIRVHLVAAALESGLLDALAQEAQTTAELVGRLGVSNEEVFAPFLRTVAAVGLITERQDAAWRLTPRGTAVIEDDLDLLLRAQEGQMELPDVEELVGQLTSAGLTPGPPRRIAPGNPLVAVAARLER
jgi:hypothetical protein